MHAPARPGRASPGQAGPRLAPPSPALPCSVFGWFPLRDREDAEGAALLGAEVADPDPLAAFGERFGVPVEQIFGAAIERHTSLGLLERAATPDGERLRLTARGLLLANEVFVDLLADPVEASPSESG